MLIRRWRGIEQWQKEEKEEVYLCLEVGYSSRQNGIAVGMAKHRAYE
jgi:hypothetical protein